MREISIKTCIVLGIVCFVYEGVKTLKSICRSKMPPGTSPKYFLCSRTFSLNCNNSYWNLKFDSVKAKESICSNIFEKWHFCASCLHFVQCTVSYALMLAAMTYNTWVIHHESSTFTYYGSLRWVLISLGAGFATGYFFFAWFSPIKRTSKSNQLLPETSENEHDPCCNWFNAKTSWKVKKTPIYGNFP